MRARSTAAAIGILGAAVLALAPATASASGLPSYQQWQADVQKALTGVNEYLDGARAEHTAIVLDIDNTALETHYHKGRANKPVLDAAQHAQQLGMEVLIVSARAVGGEDSSMRQLSDAGYRPDRICLREHGEAKEDGKLRCRKEFTGDGLKITANIGNRSTDFHGGYFDRKFQLPDYGGELS
ncbi:HAD family acid phosphatase [Amycolatopsis minnesotensis]|uniref:HAD family acid phosphatase n=1 Tax=Amycolatopsis minnesotensis TaxID=337894 RepID=A0ABN2Q051_9PSEU